MQGRLIENLRIVPAFNPIDTTGAARTGDWVNLKFYRRCLVVIMQGAWAGGTPALTFLQAKTNAGGSSKALSYNERWTGTGQTTTADILTKGTVTSDTSNLVATAASYVLVEFHVSDLDYDNGFNYIQVNVASPGANADLIAGVYVLGDPDWVALASTLPTTVT